MSAGVHEEGLEAPRAATPGKCALPRSLHPHCCPMPWLPHALTPPYPHTPTPRPRSASWHAASAALVRDLCFWPHAAHRGLAWRLPGAHASSHPVPALHGRCQAVCSPARPAMQVSAHGPSAAGTASSQALARRSAAPEQEAGRAEVTAPACLPACLPACRLGEASPLMQQAPARRCGRRGLWKRCELPCALQGEGLRAEAC